MKITKQQLPQTDSIEEVAQFWDTHDLTDFENDLAEVADSVFASRTAIHLDLGSAEANRIADGELTRGSVREKNGSD